MLEAKVQTHHDGMAAWLIVTAPGMLLTRGVATIAFMTTAWLGKWDVDPGLLGGLGAAYLGVQALAALWMVRRPGWPSIGLGSGCLVADAVIAGLLLGAGPGLRGVGMGVAVLGIGLAFEVAGWSGTILSTCVVVAATAVLWHGIVPDVPAAPPVFGPALSVERSFSGARAPSSARPSLSSLLNIDTGFAGTQLLGNAARRFSPVLSAERSFNGIAVGSPSRAPGASLSAPPVLFALLALVAGNLVSLVRSRRVQAASAYATAVARRLAVR